MAAPNPWRGERLLKLPRGKDIKLSASLDDIARLMAATKTETLEGLQDVLFARNPETLKGALDILIGEEKTGAVWPRVNGASGLTAVYIAVSGVVSGLTPAEEEEAKKAEAARERSMQALALNLLVNASGRSSASPSESG
ncbi:hypothetical protein [Chelativorans sp. YIM 93263]|uniref:hypothetical protein n=1 Tax=Chelativorans sp. YIM 93263 TaxID=2906648 RepID=UPI002379A729|nr:hypothetical protein [Chelativorans sp. YIM 93263]